MRFKHQLSIFNAVTRIMTVLVLWLLLPMLVENVVFRHINRILVEKKQHFIGQLGTDEIKSYLLDKDSAEVYASYSALHSEFLQLSRLEREASGKTDFINEARVIEEEQGDFRILQYEFAYEGSNYQLEIGMSLSEVEELTFAINVFIFVVLAFILLVTFVADAVFIDHLLKPFHKIIDTKIRRVDQPEQFDHGQMVSGSDDFRELDQVLNQMMDRITEKFRNQKQYLGNVSHELLTPIALLQTQFENLLQNASLDEEAVDKLVGALRTLDRLKKIIHNLLLISRIDNNLFPAEQQIDLSAILNGLAEDFDDHLLDRGLQLQIKLEHHFEFKGNQTLLHILLHNLFTNAIKYNKDDGSIVISDGFLTEQYFLKVQDTGIGIAPEAQQQIFDRFARFDTTREGLGLGLSIAVRIAQFHHLEITVESTLGAGTAFTVLFPKS